MSDIPDYTPRSALAGSPLGGGRAGGWGEANVGAASARSMDDRLIPAVVIVGYILFGASILEVAVGRYTGMTIARACYFLFYLPIIILTIRQLPAVLPASLQKMTVIILLCMAPASLVWSVAPADTFERSVYLLGSSLFALYIGAVVPLRRMIILFGIGATIIAFLNFAVIYAVPSMGVTQTGLWRGVPKGLTQHKNGLGMTSALGMIFCITALNLTRDQRTRQILFAGFVMNTITIILSSARTGQAVYLVCFALAFLGMYSRRYLPIWFGSCFIIGFVIIVGGQLLFSTGLIEDILGAFGRDADLSGRLPLWQKLWLFIEQKFWLGYGYEGFWRDGTTRMRMIEAWFYFTPHYSHNGIVELWLDLGIVGVMIMVLALFGYVRDMSTYSQLRPGDPVIVTLVAFLFAFLFFNFTEASFLAAYSMNWLVFVAFSVSLAKTKAAALSQAQKRG